MIQAISSVCVVAALLTAGAALTMTLRSSPAEAATQLRQMEAAVSEVRNAHVTTWAIEDNPAADPKARSIGDLKKIEEMWYEKGRWRKEGVYGSRLIVAGDGYPRTDPESKTTLYGTYYRFDSTKHKVVSMGEAGQQPTNFSLESIMKGYQSGQQGSVTLLGSEKMQERTLRHLVVERSPKDPRYVCWVDAATNLPVRIEGQKSRDGQWVTTMRLEFEFNLPLSESLFDPSTLKDEGWTMH